MVFAAAHDASYYSGKKKQLNSYIYSSLWRIIWIFGIWIHIWNHFQLLFWYANVSLHVNVSCKYWFCGVCPLVASNVCERLLIHFVMCWNVGIKSKYLRTWLCLILEHTEIKPLYCVPSLYKQNYQLEVEMSYYFVMVKNYLCNFVLFIITNAVFYMNKFVWITVCLCGVKCVCVRMLVWVPNWCAEGRKTFLYVRAHSTGSSLSIQAKVFQIQYKCSRSGKWMYQVDNILSEVAIQFMNSWK